MNLWDSFDVPLSQVKVTFQVPVFVSHAPTGVEGTHARATTTDVASSANAAPAAKMIRFNCVSPFSY